MRKLGLLILLSIGIHSFVLAKGGGGSYYINGTAFSSSKTILKNTVLIFTLGEFTDTIVTDSNGFYEVKIPWQNACPSDKTKSQRRERNKILNPEYITITCNGKEKKIKNRWKRYGKLFPKNNKSITWKKDLIFE